MERESRDFGDGREGHDLGRPTILTSMFVPALEAFIVGVSLESIVGKCVWTDFNVTRPRFLIRSIYIYVLRSILSKTMFLRQCL